MIYEGQAIKFKGKKIKRGGKSLGISSLRFV